MQKSGQTLEKVAQRGYRFSITGDIQTPTGNNPQPPALINLTLISGMGADNLQGLLHTFTILCG